jgi:predicted ester cyclase
MSTEENKAIVQRLFEEVFNERRLNRADELVAPDYLDHAAVPGQAPGLEGAKQQRWAMYFAAIPDMHATIDDLVAEGDKVVVRYTVEGTRAVATAGRPAHRKALPDQRHLHLPPGRGEGRGELGAGRSAGPDAAARSCSCTWINQVVPSRGSVLWG